MLTIVSYLLSFSWYVISGSFLGGLFTFALCKITKKSFSSNSFTISEGAVLTTYGTFLGMFYGIGYSMSKFMNQ